MADEREQRQVKCRRTWTFPSSMSELLGTHIAHVWKKDVRSQTVVECWRRDRQRSRALVGWKWRLNLPERFTDSDSDAHVFRESLRATFVEWSIDLTMERGVNNLYVQVPGSKATWYERSVSVPMKWRLKSREVAVCREGLHGGDEAVAPRVPPVLAKPTQAEQDEHYATDHAAYRSWCEHCVECRGCVSPHVSVPEESCLNLESILPTWDRKDPK